MSTTDGDTTPDAARARRADESAADGIRTSPGGDASLTVSNTTAAKTYTDTVEKVGFDPAHPEQFEADKPTDRAVLIGIGGRWLTDWALRLAIIIVAGWLLYRVAGYLWVGILPLTLALLAATVLWPPVKLMVRLHVPSGIAALLAILGAFGIVAGTIGAIAPSVVDQTPELLESASKGIRSVQRWVQGPPLNIRDEQFNSIANEVTAVLQTRADEIANGVFAGVTRVGSGLITLVMVVVLTFFFIKDGVRFLPWLRRVVGRNAGRHLTEVLTRSWVTLSGFIRTQAIVSLVDAFFIGLGLVLLDVPLAWALAVITFLAGFIPIVGAFTAGTLAVLVALVSNGLTTALIVLVLVIAVQQLEGNILQPVLQSRSMNLHPVVVLLAVAAGGGLFGIIGAFLAVPIAAVVAVVLRYLGEQIDLRTGDRSASEVQAATEEGRLTAWLGEVGAHRFRNVPVLSGIASAVAGEGSSPAGKASRDDDVAPESPRAAATSPAPTATSAGGVDSGRRARRGFFRRMRAALRGKR